MAKRAQSKPSKASKAVLMADKAIDAALELTAEHGWSQLTLSEVAERSGVAINDLLIPFPTKYHIINAFQERIDAAMLATADPEEGADIRDRLFDLIMARFDALNSHKAAMAEITKDSLYDPSAICFLPRMRRSTTRILEAAGTSSSGLFGMAKSKGLALIYAQAFRVWLKDDTPDQSKTMAALDLGLRRAEGLMARLTSYCSGTAMNDEASA